ncbi:MAG: hypothetical protein GTO63_34920, partial [Anaerolineae bacterium]|nr:hypothetical protein [Anaerolineae bacterium]NIN99885.1 hypothetical protein [Anaerolineae bacterium]NIQ82663.1 hypothetical protein [Anaerolineae bacterium]
VSPKARELFTQDAHQVAPDDIFGEARTNVGSPPPFDPDQEFKEMVDGIRQQLWGSK